ncbi:hypothetical protein NMG60_11023334 [Bertholletia excelsa]
MSFFSAISSRFTFSPSSRVSDDAGSHKLKMGSSEKSENKSSKSSGAPIVSSHFPVNSHQSRL